MAATIHSYTPSLTVVAGKRLLDGLERILPRSLYRLVYKASFGSYRSLVRFAYRVRNLWPDSERSRERATLVHRLMPYSLVGWRGLEHSFDAVKAVHDENVPGAIVELGVAQGGCAGLMALADANTGKPRRIWLFDSYEGLPEPGERDFIEGKTGAHLRPLPKGSCLGTVEQVSELLFDTLRQDRARITLVKGWFDQTVAPTKAQVGPIAVLRIDADWYESVKTCLEELYDQVSPGGKVIIDDYGSCYGAERAVDEFLTERRISTTLVPDGRGGVTWTKPAVA